MIQESVDRVRDGSTLVDESDKTLTQIIGNIRNVADIVGEIAASRFEVRAHAQRREKRLRLLLLMPAELPAHGRQDAVRIVTVAARLKSAEQCGADHWHRHACVYGCGDGPAAFA